MKRFIRVWYQDEENPSFIKECELDLENHMDKMFWESLINRGSIHIYRELDKIPATFWK